MRANHVVFDRANTRVGFGPLSTCPPATSTATGTVVPSTSTGEAQHSEAIHSFGKSLFVVVSSMVAFLFFNQ